MTEAVFCGVPQALGQGGCIRLPRERTADDGAEGRGPLGPFPSWRPSIFGQRHSNALGSTGLWRPIFRKQFFGSAYEKYRALPTET